jgi:hypothetical protein
MSVFMTLWAQGDPAAIERQAAEDPATLRSIADLARSHGCLSHRFFGRDGQILVVDEWESEDGFHAFFREAQDRIGPMMAAAGVTSEPAISFWRKLDTNDDVG